MHKCGIHTGNGVLVSRLFDKNKLKHGTIIIYEIDPSRYTHDHPEATQPLFKKLDKARKYFENKRVTISITYKEEQKDYSIHSFAELYGIVRYIIPEEHIKN